MLLACLSCDDQSFAINLYSLSRGILRDKVGKNRSYAGLFREEKIQVVRNDLYLTI